jgi:DNA-directed RNA polymerase specialized sigma24 family protein
MLDDYIIRNYDKLKDIAYNMAGSKEHEEFLHFIIEQLYDHDQIKLNEVIERNEMLFYVTRIMINQYHSKTSRYYYKYKKYYKHHVTGIVDGITSDNVVKTIEQKQDEEQKLSWIEEKLKDLYWFDAEVFKLYYRENFTLTEMAKATKISRGTLYKAISNVKDYLKNER